MRSQARAALAVLRSPSQRQHFWRWLWSSQRDYLLRKGQPWMTFDAIDYLDSIPIKRKRVFEYGSGGSTLYWLNRGAQLTSIEHDCSWHSMLRDGYLGDIAVDYRLVLPEFVGDANLDPSDPDSYASRNQSFPQHSFKSYCSQIDEFPDGFFDLVVIDGRARPSCIKHGSSKVKPGGHLVLDNSDRAYYLEKTTSFLCDYEKRTFPGTTPSLLWPTETTVFRKKA